MKRHPLLSATMVAVCEREMSRGRVRHFTRCVEALRDLRIHPAEILVCGLNLGDCDGLDLLEVVHAESLARSIVIVSDRKDERVLDRLRRYKERAVMVDADALDEAELTWALQRARSGEGHVSASIREAWAHVRQAPDGFSLRLTEAEQAVLAYSAAWSEDHLVASRRGRSLATVQTQRKRAMRKLGLRSRAELVVYAVRAGLLRFDGNATLFPGLEANRLRAAAAAFPPKT
ncbi:MAG: LuxR C-terminal-related transcriptional regulator [Opitutales bacterium]